MKDIYTYEDEFGNECTFLRGKYYEQVCAIITDFFKEPLPDNEFYRHFINLLNNLEDYNDVYNLTTEMPFYWAICIIENQLTNNHLIKNKTNDDYKEWAIKYKQENDIITFILEGINEETYVFNNEKGGKSIFLRDKYYQLVCSLVTDFFKMPFEYNLIRGRLINNLNALYDNGNYEDIIQFIDKQPYYWAISIIENKETITVLNENQLEEYNKFLNEFFETNNITSFMVSEI